MNQSQQTTVIDFIACAFPMPDWIFLTQHNIIPEIFVVV